MVATISHEINQPLAAVASNGDAALRWLAKSPPNLDEVETALTRIVRDAHRANAVIRRTRALFAHGDAAYSEVDLNDAVTEVVSLTAGEIRSAGVIAELYLAHDLPRVRGDRIQLQQVLLNLILNARDAMTGVSDHRARLKIVTEIAADGGVLVSVEDAGVGLEASMIDRVFDRFVTTKVDGTGMGLAICKTIIEAHGGRIWASPGPTFGAVLRFTLPPLGAISA
jgi:signal transduction histidine kinase